LYLLCVGASYVLQRRDVRMAGAPFIVPGGPVIQLAAAAGIFWFLMQATRREWQIQALALGAASVYYVFRARFARKTASAFSPSPAQDQ
jgi:basic amino acid/polyamine antiporter, APA family